jgi:hypothetical protein
MRHPSLKITRRWDFAHPKNLLALQSLAHPAKKLVEHPKDWPWSSWSFYAKGEAGLVTIDPFGG